MLRSRLAALAIAGAVLVAACGGSSATTAPVGAPSGAAADVPSVAAATPPSATAAPATPTAPAQTASTTPAPVDASAAFAKAIGDSIFTAHVALSGTSTLGSARTTTSGTIDLHGPSSHQRITTSAGGHKTTVESSIGNGSRYTTRFGVWFLAGRAPAHDLVTVIRSLSTGVRDLGAETLDGQLVHHLSVTTPAGVAEALGLAGTGVSNVLASIDAWALEDGTPVKATIGATWDQAVHGKTVHGTRTLDLAFSNVDVPMLLAVPPTAPWIYHTSKHTHYRMAYPSTWEFVPAKGKYIDGYWGFDGQGVFVDRVNANGNSLGQESSWVMRNPSRAFSITGAKVLSNKPAKLGSLPARRVEIRGTYKGVKHWWVFTFAVKSGYWYVLQLRTDAKTTAADRVLAAQFARFFTVR